MAEGKPGIHGPDRREAEALNKLPGKSRKGPGRLVRAGIAALGSVAPPTGAIAPVELPPTPPAIIQEDQRPTLQVPGVNIPDVTSVSQVEPSSPYDMTPEELLAKLRGEYNAKILDTSPEEMDSQAWYELAVNRRAAMVALMKKDPAEARKFIRDEEEEGSNIKAIEKLASVLEMYPSEAQRQRKEDLIEEEIEGWEGTFVLSISDLSQRPGMALYIKSDKGSVGFELTTEEHIEKEFESQSDVVVEGIRLEYTILPNIGGVGQASP